MRKLLALPIVMVAFAANMWALGEARYTGKVVDQNNNPVADATITVDSLEAKKLHQVFKTDKKGNFAVFLLDGTIRYKFTYEKEGVGAFSEEKKLKLAPEKNEATIVLASAAAAAGTTQVQTGKADPATVLYNEGAALANTGDLKGAVAKFEEAVKVNPDFAAGWIALTKMYGRTEQWQKAIDAGVKAYEADSDDEDLNSVLATAYRKTGQAAKAAQYESKLPKNAAAIFNEAARAINAGDNAKAETLLKQAIEADDKFAQAYYELGMLYAGQDKKADAKKNLAKYLELSPNGKDAATAKEMLNYLK